MESEVHKNKHKWMVKEKKVGINGGLRSRKISNKSMYSKVEGWGGGMK
jgi:hypothetical protein